MNGINPKIPLAIIGIVILTAVVTYYAPIVTYYSGTTSEVIGCNQYFYSEGDDGHLMPFPTRFTLYERKNETWEHLTQRNIPADPIGLWMWLKRDIQYKAVPFTYEGWMTPDEQAFYGCAQDCRFIYTSTTPVPTCTPGEWQTVTCPDGTEVAKCICNAAGVWACSEDACEGHETPKTSGSAAVLVTIFIITGSLIIALIVKRRKP